MQDARNNTLFMSIAHTPPVVVRSHAAAGLIKLIIIGLLTSMPARDYAQGAVMVASEAYAVIVRAFVPSGCT